ncbi:MAG: HAD family hydrolase [Candidatus Omnitrophota bacterium]
MKRYRGIRLVIFDLDGTLVDAYPAITRSFNHAMRSLGLGAKAPAVIRRAVGWGDENLLRPFLAKKDLRKALSLYRRHHRKALLENSSLFKGALKLLSYLKRRGYKLAVASNRPSRFSLILMRHLGLDAYFDYMLCADKLKRGKPSPQILRRIMRRFGFYARQTLYVGDMVIDAQAGRRAGVSTVIVTTGSSSKKDILREMPSAVIRNIRQLSAML